MLRLRTNVWATVATAVLLHACSSEDPGGGRGEDPLTNDDEDDDESSDESGSSDEGSSSGRTDAGKRDSGTTRDSGGARDSGAARDSGGSAPRDSGTGGDAKPPTGGGDEIPCEVSEIVEEKCLLCHGEMTGAGVPFSLVTLDDFQGQVPGKETSIAESIVERINQTGPSAMPPAGTVPALSAAQKQTLTDWLEGGAQGGAGCTTMTPATTDGGTPPTGGGKGGSGGVHAEPIEYDDPLLKCYEFRAFTQGNKTRPYTVGNIPDFYVAFDFNPPWQGTQYVRSFRGLVDNEKVIHHWLFFQQAILGGETVTENALGAHPDGQMLAGWAPGGSDLYFDPDVAFEVPGNVNYQLEAHYNNTEFGAQSDASGVELCVTPTRPAHVAGLSWVGTDAIIGTEATGRCGHGSLEDIHLISAQPHMHTKGRHMKVVLERADGSEEIIHDQPFDFNYQRSYIMDITIRPGDQLWTTCTFSEFAVFGKGTNDEMCYFFSNYYPKGSLTSLGVGTLIHGANSCIDI